MITVHVRWEDKVAGARAEMEMVTISKYLDAVSLLVAQFGQQSSRVPSNQRH